MILVGSSIFLCLGSLFLGFATSYGMGVLWYKLKWFFTEAPDDHLPPPYSLALTHRVERYILINKLLPSPSFHGFTIVCTILWGILFLSVLYLS